MITTLFQLPDLQLMRPGSILVAKGDNAWDGPDELMHCMVYVEIRHGRRRSRIIIATEFSLS